MNQKTRGFTIIEVSLVLMIAGLIFLMAFIALPSLWASQRDAERKANIMEFVAAVKNYQTNNNRGALPVLSGNGPDIFTGNDARNTAASETSNWRAFARDYLAVDFADPDSDYTFYIVKCLAADGRTELATGATCEYRKNGHEDDFGAINQPDNLNINKTAQHKIYVAIGATCDGDHAVKTNSSRNVAAVQVLEHGVRYCDNT